MTPYTYQALYSSVNTIFFYLSLHQQFQAALLQVRVKVVFEVMKQLQVLLFTQSVVVLEVLKKLWVLVVKTTFWVGHLINLIWLFQCQLPKNTFLIINRSR